MNEKVSDEDNQKMIKVNLCVHKFYKTLTSITNKLLFTNRSHSSPTFSKQVQLIILLKYKKRNINKQMWMEHAQRIVIIA